MLQRGAEFVNRLAAACDGDLPTRGCSIERAFDVVRLIRDHRTDAHHQVDQSFDCRPNGRRQ